MAAHSNSQTKKLQAEVTRLRQENKELKANLASKKTGPKQPRHVFRSIGMVLCLGLAVALLVVGNLFFWAGNTLVKTDRYVEATAPIIQDPAVQDALARRTTQKLFENTDIDQLVESALPPQAAFLAEPISERVHARAETTIHDIVRRPQFQERWNNAQERAHARFIELINEHGSDGSIDLSDVYVDISEQLKDTKLAFLADKPLPEKVGSVQLVSGGWLTSLQRIIQNIDAWRSLAIGLLVIFSGLGIWLSRNRRKTFMALSSLFALAMFVTILSIRLGREVLAGQIDTQYTEAIRNVYTIFLHPLVVQTFTILFLMLTMIFIAWISGPSASSRKARLKIDQLFSGNLHSAIFSKENGLTKWVGRRHNLLLWLSVGLVAATALFTRLTPMFLLGQILIIMLLVGIIEILAAPKQQLTSK